MRQSTLVAKNTFLGGLRRDETPYLSSDKSYYFALNAITATSQHRGFGIANEGSNKYCNTQGKIVGEHYLEERNQRILLKEGDEFWLFDDETLREHLIFKASEFGCSFNLGGCEWHDVESALVKTCNETHVYFSSKGEYYFFNLDEMLDVSRKEGLKKRIECESLCDSGCDVFKVMQCACSPKTNAQAYQSGGGQLRAGSYQFIGRFINSDGGETNWFNMSNPAYVGSENNIAGEEGNGHIEVQFSCLDCRFSKIEVAVIERVGGVVTAKTLGVKSYGDTRLSINYYGNDGTPIDITELLVKGQTYIQGKSLHQRDGRMYYYRIKERNNLNYQPLAVGIDTSYVVYEVPYEYAKKHNLKSLMRGETYAFGIVWNYKDGTHSEVFHIPGTPSGSAKTNESSDYTGTGDYKPGVGGGATRRPKSSDGGSPTEEIACEYDFEEGNTTVLFEVSGSELKILSTEGSAFLQCARDAQRKKGVITVCLEYEGGEVEFQATGLLEFEDSMLLRLSGNLISGSTVSSAKEVDTGFVKCATAGNNQGNGGSAGMGGGGGGQSDVSQPQPSISQDQCVVRKREHKKTDDVHTPQHDDFDDEIQGDLNNHNTVIADISDEARLHEASLMAQCCQCKSSTEEFPPETFTCAPEEGGLSEADCVAIAAAAPSVCCPSGPECSPGKAVEQSEDDHPDVEKTASSWLGMLASYLKDDLDASADMSSVTTMKDAAKLVMDRIQERERIYERKKRKYSISKPVSYGGGSSILKKSNEETSIGSNIADGFGAPETEVELTIVSTGSPTPKYETNIYYPCTTDCDGNPLYGALAGSPVAHHKFPDASTERHYVSKSVGVPSELTPEADEYSDGYVRLMGPRFSNIQTPSEDDLPIPLCSSNPYTIVMVKRTDKNKTVLLKGMSTSTFNIENNGKQYHQPKHAVNSRTYVSRYHDNNGCRLSQGGSGGSHNIYSLDGLVRKPSLNANLVRHEGIIRGIGYRHRLYSKGQEPNESFRGERIDNLGAIQAVNVNQFEPAGGELPLDFKEYADPNTVVAPPPGGSTPLNNKFQQHNIWIGAGLPDHEDDSFIGDVLDHAAPIESATANYVSLVRELDDQYGSLENLSYIPILWAGKAESYNGTIEGPTGDVYIGPYSFVKTGYVSDKVGRGEGGSEDSYCTSGAGSDKFNIPAQVPTKNERRCICDGPDDVINQFMGLWVWTDLPEDGDAADPKNWAGTHTTASRTRPHSEATGNPATSDMYFPRVVKTMITYWGEFEVNPRLREKTDTIKRQWYPEIKENFRLHNGSSIDGTGAWGNVYLAQFQARWRQPSEYKKLLKGAIRMLVTVGMAVWGIDNTFDVTTGLSLVGNLAEYPFMVILWYLLNQVLLKNDVLDKWLGIPVCKSDEVGNNSDELVQDFFVNYDRYNFDYSDQNDVYVYSGMPDNYYTCKCNDIECGEYSNAVYYSDKQYSNSNYAAYRHVRPNNYLNIPAHAGKLTNLFSRGGGFYAHTTDAIWQLQYGREAVPTDVGSIILGTGSLLAEPQTPTQGMSEGFAGLQYHNAAINTQFGYFFVDADARKVYKFDQGLEEISGAGMFNYFKNKLGFCDCPKCVDQKVSGTAFYSLGVDPRHNRFLITKNEPNQNNSFTLSYDLTTKTWISFHSYKPRAYFWSRNDMFTLQDGIWKHNESCNFQNFYGTYYPHILEFTAVGRQGQQPLKSFEFQEATLRTESEICETPNCAYIQDLDHTFNKINIRNTTQTTGTLNTILIGDDANTEENISNLIVEKPKSIRFHKVHREYNFNEVHDHRLIDCTDKPLITCSECEPYGDIVEYECSAENKQNYAGKVMADDHITYRLILDDGKDDHQLRTIYMETFAPKSPDNKQP